MNSSHLAQALNCINNGGVIAYPTEAVWGVGCDPRNETAVRKILEIKQRPTEKGLILVGSSLEQFSDWIKPLSDQELAQLQPTWPGPVTWVLPCVSETPDWLRGEHSSLAIRISAHPIIRILCDQAGALVSTSANPAGEEPARTQTEVEQYFPDQLDYILPGELGGLSQPSQIRTLSGERLR